MKMYIEAELEIIVFENHDVITTSCGSYICDADTEGND